MGDISLLGVVDIMTGEKDPRNLMVVFSILKVVMVEWDISNHVEVCTLLAAPQNCELTPERHCLTQYITTSRSHSDPRPTIHTESLHRTSRVVSKIASLRLGTSHLTPFPHYWTSSIPPLPM
jgi:hypothetical protein